MKDEEIMLIYRLASKLIDVAQISYVGQGSKVHDQYSLLFNQIFPRNHSAGSSSSPVHETERTWLRKILADSDRKEAHKWNSVEPISSGGLVMQFDEVLSRDNKPLKINK